jgi:hypothetical protein
MWLTNPQPLRQDIAWHSEPDKSALCSLTAAGRGSVTLVPYANLGGAGGIVAGIPDMMAGKFKSNNGWPRAQFVPNTPHTRGHSRLIMVRPFLCIEGNRLARASSDFVFQAGHVSSIFCCSTTARCRFAT